jgi:hypothetical protein
MFPLEYPFRILKGFRQSPPVVLDPFCGRGTTIYAARHMGMVPWGIDTSPIAVAIARAKLASASLEEADRFIDELLASEPDRVPETAFFRSAFSKGTLHEVCSLRQGLMRMKKNTDVSVLVRAAALGCLHGPRSKTRENAAYFSNQMPRTFSTKPSYSVRYWKEGGLKAPKVGAKEVLLRKLERVLALKERRCGTLEQILLADAADPATYKRIDKNFSVVITSPPYYGMRTYIQDQWLRMWFLGGPEEIDYVADEQLDDNGQDSFIRALASVWRNLHGSAAEELHMYVRFGSVPSVESDAKGIMRASFEEARGWKLVSTRTARDAHAGKRQADQMAKGSKAAEEYDFHVVRAAA